MVSPTLPLAPTPPHIRIYILERLKYTGELLTLKQPNALDINLKIDTDERFPPRKTSLRGLLQGGGVSWAAPNFPARLLGLSMEARYWFRGPVMSSLHRRGRRSLLRLPVSLELGREQSLCTSEPEQLLGPSLGASVPFLRGPSGRFREAGSNPG